MPPKRRKKPPDPFHFSLLFFTRLHRGQTSDLACQFLRHFVWKLPCLPGNHSGFCPVHALKNRPDLVAFRGVLGFDAFVLFCSVARVWVRITLYVLGCCSQCVQVRSSRLSRFVYPSSSWFEDACRSIATMVSVADVGPEDQGLLYDAVEGVLVELLSHLQWSLCFFKVQTRPIGPLLTVSSHLYLLLHISDFQVCLLLLFPSPGRIICSHGYCLLANTLKPHLVQVGFWITLALVEVIDVNALWLYCLIIDHSKLWFVISFFCCSNFCCVVLMLLSGVHNGTLFDGVAALCVFRVACHQPVCASFSPTLYILLARARSVQSLVSVALLLAVPLTYYSNCRTPIIENSLSVGGALADIRPLSNPSGST